jgi:hypothetical protein
MYRNLVADLEYILTERNVNVGKIKHGIVIGSCDKEHVLA